MPKWEHHYDGRTTPNGEPFRKDDVPIGMPGDKALGSERELWFYIAKGIGLLYLGGIAVTLGMYGLFEALSWLE